MRQPPENSRQRPVLRRLVEAEAAQDLAPRAPARRGRSISTSRVWISAMRRGSSAVSASSSKRRALAVGASTKSISVCRAAWRLLLDPADAGAAGKRDRAALGRDLACDQAEQRGLAGAVAADQADMRAGRQRHARPVDQQAFAEPIGEIVDMQHGGAFRRAASRKARGAGASQADRRGGGMPRFACGIAFAAAAVIYAPPFNPPR